MQIDDPRQGTVQRVFRALEQAAEDWRRPHLGASVLGKSCERELWYGFRWSVNPRLEGRVLALLDRGDREEEVQFERMRLAGLEVWERDPETGEQFRVDLGPHLGGSLDSVVRGLDEAPKTLHVLDVKTAKNTEFNRFVKVGAAEWKPQYVAQLQVYMHGMKLERAVLWVVCKNTDRVHMERIRYDQAEAERLIAKGQRVVEAEQAPVRVSEDPEWFECRFCTFREVCHEGQVHQVERNCRTCISSTACPDGTWRCELKETELDLDAQKAGCPSHLLRPDYMPQGWEAVEADEEGRAVVYETPGGSKWVDREGGVSQTC